MKANLDTAVEATNLSTAPTKIFAANLENRRGIFFHASSGNSANIYLCGVVAGDSAPTLDDDASWYELSPGQSFTDDEGEFHEHIDVYACMASGTGAYNAREGY